MLLDQITYRVVGSPVGDFVAGATSKGCCLFEFLDRGGVERIVWRSGAKRGLGSVSGTSGLIDRMEKEVSEYFDGSRKTFSVPLDMQGTPFEMTVWKELLKIPYGETRSYGEVAAALGKPGAARAVGGANGANCLAIIVPCHRVIQEDGSLRGYGGGLWRKRFLLELEGCRFTPDPCDQPQLQMTFSV